MCDDVIGKPSRTLGNRLQCSVETVRIAVNVPIEKDGSIGICKHTPGGSEKPSAHLINVAVAIPRHERHACTVASEFACEWLCVVVSSCESV